jgi:cbb3-type cytochrome oxidase subunit 3
VVFVGLALIPLLVTQTGVGAFEVYAQNYFVGVAFIALCLLGIIAVFYPAKCRGIFEKSQVQTAPQNADSLPIIGHHPDCKQYSPNRITFGDRKICAACSGLLVGGVVALVLVVLYFFASLTLFWGSIWLLVLGEALLVLGLAQIKFSSYGKAAVNALFVVGAFLVLAQTDMLSGGLLMDVYVLGLIAYTLWLRILLSEWNNRRTCLRCKACF